MCDVFEPQKCGQCACDSAKFEYDSGTGGYEITCGRCGRSERHMPRFDDEGIYSGFQHDFRKGFGVLFYRFVDNHEFYSHSLNTPREVIGSELWLRKRLDNGTIEAETACLTRWYDDAQSVVVIFGELFDILAGKITRMCGIPGDVERDNRDNRQSRLIKGSL